MDLAAAKARICDEVDRRAELLIDVSHRLHHHPELAFEEVEAHRLLTEVLAAEGWEPERGAHGMPTAFAAEAGDRGPRVAVLCEYDALPGIGHACGHNVIAAAGLGAALAARALAGEVGGRIVVLGTPAEEGGGGKVRLLRAGAFAGLDAALMVHPADRDLARMDAIAITQVHARYQGRAAHAAAAPEQGRNALDGAVLGYVNVAALRQHLAPGERVHGVFTDGGDKPNIVPARAATLWYVRSPDVGGLQSLVPRVVACLRAGADAAGVEVTFERTGEDYADVRSNGPLEALYRANAAALGRSVGEPSAGQRVVGSTDMGNVSYAVPSIHPMIACAPPGVAIHTAEFERHSGSAAGDQAVLDGAKAMAMTVADLWLDDEARHAVTSAFTPIDLPPPVPL